MYDRSPTLFVHEIIVASYRSSRARESVSRRMLRGHVLRWVHCVNGCYAYDVLLCDDCASCALSRAPTKRKKSPMRRGIVGSLLPCMSPFVHYVLQCDATCSRIMSVVDVRVPPEDPERTLTPKAFVAVVTHAILCAGNRRPCDKQLSKLRGLAKDATKTHRPMTSMLAWARAQSSFPWNDLATCIERMLSEAWPWATGFCNAKLTSTDIVRHAAGRGREVSRSWMQVAKSDNPYSIYDHEHFQIMLTETCVGESARSPTLRFPDDFEAWPKRREDRIDDVSDLENTILTRCVRIPQVTETEYACPDFNFGDMQKSSTMRFPLSKGRLRKLRDVCADPIRRPRHIAIDARNPFVRLQLYEAGSCRDGVIIVHVRCISTYMTDALWLLCLEILARIEYLDLRIHLWRNGDETSSSFARFARTACNVEKTVDELADCRAALREERVILTVSERARIDATDIFVARLVDENDRDILGCDDAQYVLDEWACNHRLGIEGRIVKIWDFANDRLDATARCSEGESRRLEIVVLWSGPSNAPAFTMTISTRDPDWSPAALPTLRVLYQMSDDRPRWKNLLLVVPHLTSDDDENLCDSGNANVTWLVQALRCGATTVTLCGSSRRDKTKRLVDSERRLIQARADLAYIFEGFL